MKKVSKAFDVICFVIGPFITIVSLLGFRGSTLGFSGGGVRYYYSLESKIGIGIGVALICVGGLRIYWQKKNKIEEPK